MDLLKFGIRLQISEEKLSKKNQEVEEAKAKSDVVETNGKKRNKTDDNVVVTDAD